MKKIILILIIILLSLNINNYVELNNLVIIDSIGLSCNKDTYTLYLKEIIPTKESNLYNYKYKVYEDTSDSIKKSYKTIENSINKKIYINKTKHIITNCKTTTKLIKYFNIAPTTIKHTNNNIKKELSTTS